MSVLKIEIASGSFELKLEGEPSVVSSLFDSIRNSGLGALHDETSYHTVQESTAIEKQTPISEQLDKTIKDVKQGPSSSPNESWPTFETVVLQGRPKNSQEWILICIAYATSFGTKDVGDDEVKKQLQMTKRFNGSLKKNYARSVRCLADKDFIQALADHKYIISEAGLNEAHQIVCREQKPSTKRKRTTTPKLAQYQLLESLVIDDDQKKRFRDDWKTSIHSSAMDKTVFIAGWLQQNLQVREITVDHIFTMLRIASENASFNIFSALKNSKNLYNYFSNGSEPNSFVLTHIGEDHFSDMKTNA